MTSIFYYKINQIEELIGDIINKRKKKMGYYILGVVILTLGTALIGVSVVIYITYNLGMI